MTEARNIRRVITGHDDNGKAVVIRDSDSEHTLSRPNRPGVTLTNLWQVTKAPARMEIREDAIEGPLILHPPENGSIFRIVQFNPEDPEVMKTLDGESAFAEMGASANIVENARHPFMHRTDSVDYAVIISGEITMMLDDTDVQLKAGDTIIQQGTNHAWSNRGSVPCLIAFVLVDAVKD